MPAHWLQTRCGTRREGSRTTSCTSFFANQTRPGDLTGFGDLNRVVSPGDVKVRNQRENEETGEVVWFAVQELKYRQYVVWDEYCGPKRIQISAPLTGLVWLSSRDGKEDLLKRCDVEDPPPWLINMQCFCPSPSYPDLKTSSPR